MALHLNATVVFDCRLVEYNRTDMVIGDDVKESLSVPLLMGSEPVNTDSRRTVRDGALCVRVTGCIHAYMHGLMYVHVKVCRC